MSYRIVWSLIVVVVVLVFAGFANFVMAANKPLEIARPDVGSTITQGSFKLTEEEHEAYLTGTFDPAEFAAKIPKQPGVQVAQVVFEEWGFAYGPGPGFFPPGPGWGPGWGGPGWGPPIPPPGFYGPPVVVAPGCCRNIVVGTDAFGNCIYQTVCGCN